LLNWPQGIMQSELVPQSPSFYSLFPVFSLPCSPAPLFPVFVILSESRRTGTSRRTCICFCICLWSRVPPSPSFYSLLPTPYSLSLSSRAKRSSAEPRDLLLFFVPSPQSLSPCLSVPLFPVFTARSNTETCRRRGFRRRKADFLLLILEPP